MHKLLIYVYIDLSGPMSLYSIARQDGLQLCAYRTQK